MYNFNLCKTVCLKIGYRYNMNIDIIESNGPTLSDVTSSSSISSNTFSSSSIISNVRQDNIGSNIERTLGKKLGQKLGNKNIELKCQESADGLSCQVNKSAKLESTNNETNENNGTGCNIGQSDSNHHSTVYLVIWAIIWIILTILFFCTLKWEFNDYFKLCSRPHIDKIKRRRDRHKEMRFHACYNYENRVDWRGVYVGSFIATFVISLLMEICGLHWFSRGQYYVPLVVLTIIFISFYVISSYQHFHVYRIMCSKVDNRLETAFGDDLKEYAEYCPLQSST